MEKPDQEWNEDRIHLLMGNLLRIGVMVSAAVVAVGAVMFLVKYGSMPTHYRTFRGEPVFLRNVPSIFRFALAEHTRGLIQVGLLLLIATPIARVVFSVYAFARERDRMYVGITTFVLVVLLFSLVGNRI